VIVIKPPSPIDLPADTASVFLAGSIEMGAAIDWQADITARFADLHGVILNPRRDDWDPTWKQSMDDARFRGQVEWELDGLDRASVIAMWFVPETRAPVTLLELGLYARSGRVIVGCPEGFWRRGNVEIVCARSGIPMLASFEDFVAAVRKRLTAAG
jgi:nucleoside 2-deoxyribosyltransferase-like protein